MASTSFVLCGIFVAAALGAPLIEVGQPPLPPNPNNWTAQCTTGQQQLYTLAGKEFSQVADDAAQQAGAATRNCSSDFEKHLPCTVTLTWEGPYAADVAALASALKAKDSSAILCYVDSTVTSSVRGIGNFTITVNNVQIYPFSSQCSAADRQGYLKQLSTGCSRDDQRGSTCTYTFANATCN